MSFWIGILCGRMEFLIAHNWANLYFSPKSPFAQVTAISGHGEWVFRTWCPPRISCALALYRYGVTTISRLKLLCALSIERKRPLSSFALYRYGVATISRLLKKRGLFCKRALQERPNTPNPIEVVWPSIQTKMCICACGFPHTRPPFYARFVTP